MFQLVIIYQYVIQEMCKLIENNCKVLQIKNSWPAEFNCENETLYPLEQCKVNYYVKLEIIKVLLKTE